MAFFFIPAILLVIHFFIQYFIIRRTLLRHGRVVNSTWSLFFMRGSIERRDYYAHCNHRGRKMFWLRLQVLSWVLFLIWIVVLILFSVVMNKQLQKTRVPTYEPEVKVEESEDDVDFQ